MEQIYECLAVDLKSNVDDVRAALELSDAESFDKVGVLVGAFGVGRELAQKCRTFYVHHRRKFTNGNGKAAHVEAPPAVPVEFREAMLVVSAVDKLRKKRAGLEGQVHDIEQEIAKVDAEIKTYAPVLEKAAALSKAVQTMKMEVRQA